MSGVDDELMARATPIALPDQWSRVMTVAGRQCQCVGQCGRHKYRPKKDERMTPEQVTGRSRCDVFLPRRLYAAPVDPSIAVDQAWKHPDAELMAWCGKCLDGSRAEVRRDIRATKSGPGGTADLLAELEDAS